ncbi:hypothetical protein HAPAU_03140 [Halalkalicoccus paucihalophilus]|uniref:Uncharacterized protein n=1 Tax=Halalkalicoccus paucihalophilus TaxID=1008153 RepID=A0A151AIZ3_9EURY|nr:hypothetical protein [Halalkalicoccus paucihalophilus]KYH27646.1 hypothetical protein HAPAU_03140 [Halalkalicoccus paucihalophilus]
MQRAGGALVVLAVLLLVGLLPGVALVPNLPGASIAIIMLAVGTLLIGVARERRPV